MDAAGNAIADISFTGFTMETSNAGAATHFAFSVPLDAHVVGAVVAWQIRDKRGAVHASLSVDGAQ